MDEQPGAAASASATAKQIEAATSPKRWRWVVLALAAVVLAATTGTALLLTRDRGPDRAARRACDYMGEAAKSLSFGDASVRGLVTSAIHAAEDTNDGPLREVVADLDDANRSGNRTLGSAAMRDFLYRCDELFGGT